MGAGVPRPCSAKRANASTTPGHTCENHYRSDAARQLQTKERRPELPTRDPPRNEPRQRKWGDHEENRRAQDGNGSLHGGSRYSLRAHSNLPFMASRRHPDADTLAMLYQKLKTAHESLSLQ